MFSDCFCLCYAYFVSVYSHVHSFQNTSGASRDLVSTSVELDGPEYVCVSVRNLSCHLDPDRVFPLQGFYYKTTFFRRQWSALRLPTSLGSKPTQHVCFYYVCVFLTGPQWTTGAPLLLPPPASKGPYVTRFLWDASPQVHPSGSDMDSQFRIASPDSSCPCMQFTA